MDEELARRLIKAVEAITDNNREQLKVIRQQQALIHALVDEVDRISPGSAARIADRVPRED